MTIDMPNEVDSPQGNVLNYSIVSSDEEENSIRLKLKVSKRTKIPLIVLKKLEDNDQYVVSSPRASNRTRVVKRFEGFEMNMPPVSPKDKNNDVSTPRKRGRSRKTDNVDVEMSSPIKIQKAEGRSSRKADIDQLCYLIKDSVRLKTPVKNTVNNTTPRKNGSLNVTPIKETPSRKGSRQIDNFNPIKTDENQSILSGKRRSVAPLRFFDEYSPKKSVKVNLNESFRRAVLKSRHNVENIGNHSDSKVRDSSVRSRKSSRKTTASEYYYDSDEAVQVAEVLMKSELEVSATGRVLRSRSNSTASNGSAASDLDYIVQEPLTKIRKPRTKSTTSNDSNGICSSPERVSPKKSPLKTPKTPRNKKEATVTPKTVPFTPKTPKNRLKLIRDGVITPSMHSRTSILPGDSTPLMKARSQLHVSYVPSSLPCREKEYLDVYNFLRGKLEDGCGGCMYISGVPGTGKTATVTSVIDSLKNGKGVPKFCDVNINGMRLTEPRQSYVEIWKQLTGKTVPWEQAQSLLEERFTKRKNLRPVVMLIDELDILCTKRQDVVYNLLDWPSKSKDQLIVITIANTMDLPERLLMSRVTSRLGLTRLTFQAYTHKQLMEIVTKRLMGTDSFNSDAVQLVARKVASVSGDARRALDICRRAAEIAEEEGKGQLVGIMHINEALTAMITQPQVTAIRRCSRLQQLLLQAIVAEIERTGVEETTFADTFRILVSCCALDGFKMVSSTAAQRALSQLSACKLILTDQKCGDIYQRVLLNVSVHDVYFALKKD